MLSRRSLLGATLGLLAPYPAEAGLHLHGAPLAITNLPIWATAVANMQAGISNARLLCLGDSTTVAFGAVTNSSYVGAQTKSYPTALQGLFNSALGLPSLNNYFWNDGNVNSVGATLATYDSRVVLGAGWASITADIGFGGNNLSNSTTANALTFSPGVSFDTIDVYYATNAGLGSFTVDIGGVSLGTISCVGSAGYAKQSFTVSAGINTVNLKRVSGNALVCAVNTYNAAQKSIHIIEAGYSGSVINNILQGSSDGYAAIPNLGLFAPHLTALCATINDWRNGTNLVQFQNDTQSVITAAKVFGDVVLMTGCPTIISDTPQATQDQYTAIYHTLATNNNLKLIDMKTQWGSFVAANAAALMSDTIHESGLGYGNGGSGLLGLSKLVYNALTT